MKATLHFDLDKPEDYIAYQHCLKSGAMAGVLFELTANLKKNIERKIEDVTLSNEEVLTLVFRDIADFIEQKGINLEELI